ncbi:hypothetical protein AB0J86_24160 [Micromonospora sp. NPDC049559]|uniref:hypothetical protein n=1 Tax=Micromonospora sp. NPDC049559 TaxID=3155923 RepID=UPI003432B12F
MSKPALSRRMLLGAVGTGTAGTYLAPAGPASAAPAQAVAAGDTVLELASRADAPTSTVPAEVAAIRTAGYAAPGDGGGALYRRLAEEPVPPRAWHLSTAGGAWWEIADEVVSVRALGAKGNYDEATTPIDPSNDDTAAFLAAAELDRVIHVPATPHAYRVEKSILLKRDGTTWYGDGYESKIVLTSIATGVGQLIGISGEPPTRPDGDPARTVRGVRVSGLHLDTRNSVNNNGLGMSFARDVRVDDMYFSRIGRKAVTCQYHCHDSHVRDVTVEASAQERYSQAAAISVEGQTAGLTYSNGVVAVDRFGADMTNLTFDTVSCAASGYSYAVVSNARRVTLANLDFGDVTGNLDENGNRQAGAFVVFTRTVQDSVVRSVRGGNSIRKMIWFGAAVQRCMVEDFRFGATTGAAGDGHAIHCEGPANTVRDGSFAHRNTASTAILVGGADVTLAGVHVTECASNLVVGMTTSAARLSLLGSTLYPGTAVAFQVTNACLIQGNRFMATGAPTVGRFDATGNRFLGNHLAGSGSGRLVVGTAASAIISGNVFGGASSVDFQGGSLAASVFTGNLGATAE